MKKDIAEDVVMINPTKYACQITGKGSGKFIPKSDEKTAGKVQDYLKRDKKRNEERQIP
jgi:hypothetical protein